MTLHALWASLPAEANRPMQQRADEILDAATDLTRTLASELSPAVLDREDFQETLHWLAGVKQDEQRLDVTVETDDACPVPDRAVRDVLYHSCPRAAVQRRQARRHPERLVLSARRDGADVVVTVQDDGAGFDTSASSTDGGGLGLYSVRERIEMADGTLDVDSEPEPGHPRHDHGPRRPRTRTPPARRSAQPADGRPLCRRDHGVMAQPACLRVSGVPPPPAGGVLIPIQRPDLKTGGWPLIPPLPDGRGLG